MVKRNYKTIILVFIILAAFVLRFYKLGEIPYGFYQDESSIGYNAYSLLETGKDEHGQTFPIYFKSFGDYKLPVYIYLTAISEKVFGVNELAVRLPSALFGFLSVIVFYFFIRLLTKEDKLSLLAAGFLAINPWHIHYSRATFEVSISLFLYIIGSYLLFLFFDKKTRFYFLLGTLCFVVSLYTYNLTRLLSPLLFLWILYIQRKKILASKGEIGISAIVASILLIPFLLSFLTSGGISSASGTLIFSSASVLAPLITFKSYLVSMPEIIQKTIFNTDLLVGWQYLNNIFSYFSAAFFFVSGSSHGNHGIGTVGQFYLFEALTVILGAVILAARRVSYTPFLFGWTILVIGVASLTREVPHATRSFFLIMPLIVFSAYGSLEVVRIIGRIKNHYTKSAIGLVSIGIIVFNIIFYFVSYYVRFPVEYAKAWRSADKELSLYLKENVDKYDRIIIDKNSGFIYSSLLFYTKPEPSFYQTNAGYEPDDSEGFSMLSKFDKYEFRKVDWSSDLQNPKNLIITTSHKKPGNILPLKSFAYPIRPVVIADKQEIISFPVEDEAYVLVETK